MESRAKILGHAIHPILIVFPLGLLATAVTFDILFMIRGNPIIAWVTYWMIAAGIVGGLLAAPFGWIDWFAIPYGNASQIRRFDSRTRQYAGASVVYRQLVAAARRA